MLSALTLLLCLLPAASAAALEPPSVPAAWVTDVTATSANLRAAIEPNGLPTTYRFEYLTEAAFQAQGWSAASFVPPSGKANYGSASGPPAFQRLERLQPATSYRYRAVATNDAGTDPGPEHLLNTEQIPVAPAPCPNDAFRIGPGADLPDCRAYELVSPIDKAGGQVAAPEVLFGGGQLQAAAGPSAITYGSATAFAGPLGSPPVGQYVARRGEGSWSTENVSAPLASAAYGDRPDGAPYRLFSSNLLTGLLFGGHPCRTALPGCPFPNPVLPGSGAPAGYMAYYLRDAAGSFTSLLSPADLAHTSVLPQRFSVSLAGAVPDLSHLVLSSCAALTGDALELSDGEGGCPQAAQNLYRWGGGQLRALNLLPGEPQSTPGSRLAAPLGAISSDGHRVYFTAAENGPLYLREAALTKLVPETLGGAAFQAASTDGRLAFFTSGAVLYRYDAEAGASEPLGSGVTGVLAVSADGAHVYYQDAGGLQHWHQGATTQIAPGPDLALATDYPPATATSRLSDDGLHLAFLSDAEIPPFDNLDADTGQPHTELYLYGPPPAGGAPALLCASCNPTGERPRGSASIPGALINGSTVAYRPRALSADGARVFFDSGDRLVIADTDAAPDVYQWQAPGSAGCGLTQGCLSLISGGRTDSGRFIDASADGSDVYFLTAASLLERDPGSADLYDARIGGGFPEPPAPIPCNGDACQPLPSPPDDPAPATAVPNSGNPPPKYFKPPKKRHHRKHRKKHRHRGQQRGRP